MNVARGRAFRRDRMERIKRRVVNYHGGWAFTRPGWQPIARFIKPLDTPRPEIVGRLAHTRKPCSCWTCGHRRKWLGPTIHERRAA